MGALITLAIVLLGFMAMQALGIGAANAVFLDGGFWDGWHAAWNRPGWLFLFALVSLITRESNN